MNLIDSIDVVAKDAVTKNIFTTNFQQEGSYARCNARFVLAPYFKLCLGVSQNNKALRNHYDYRTIGVNCDLVMSDTGKAKEL